MEKSRAASRRSQGPIGAGSSAVGRLLLGLSAMGHRERGAAKGIDLQGAERLSDIESALVYRNQGARGDADSYERVGFVASEQNADSRHGRRFEQAEPEKWRPSVF